jgi:hypothetical protein
VKNVDLAKSGAGAVFPGKDRRGDGQGSPSSGTHPGADEKFYASGVPRHRLQFTADWREKDNYATRRGLHFTKSTSRTK